MKLLYWGIVGIVLAAFLTTGFQCASSEMTSAKLYLQRKDYPNAAKQLEKEVAKNPKNDEAYYLLGQVRLELKDYEGMKDAFDKAMAVAPTHQKDIQSIELSTWGKLFNQAVDAINKAADTASYLDDAISYFKTAVLMEPDSLLTQRNLGLAYYRKGDMVNAESQLSIALNKGKDLLAAKLLGRMYLDSANVLKAKFLDMNRAAFDDARSLTQIQEKMKAADVRYLLGDSMISVSKPAKPKKGDTKETWRIEHYHLTLSVEGGDVTKMKFDNDKPYAPFVDSTYYFQAVAECVKAVDVLKKAQAVYPEDAEVSETLMNAYIGAAKDEEARSLLSERVKKYPESKFDHYNLGVFLMKDSSFADAIDQFKTSLALDSAEKVDTAKGRKYDPAFSSSVVYNIAAACVNWGVSEQARMKAAGKEDDVSYKEKYRMALPYLERVVAEKTDNIQMLELLGQVYANLNMKEKAVDAYNKADALRKGKN
ncbi:MAG TPA: tetratricopeptide repeat protein [Bacteroidota bacterium]|nr:tetratricopeptide repeat protein [Bacteroidota bacterium]